MTPGGKKKFSVIIVLGILIWFCLNISSAMATEIKAFTITNIENELAFRYLFDEQTFFNASGEKTKQDTRPTFQEEYRINTNSYAFHPNLLSMELGGSLLFDQSSVETLDDENSNNEELTGFNARLDFLEQKPYPVSLFYDKQNPSVSVGLGGRFLQENIKYGADMALLQPISPVQISLNAYRQTTSGEGFDQITDDELEHSEVRFFFPYGVGNHAQITYQINNRDSRSGNPNLAIEPRTTSTTSTYFDSKNLLGESNQGQLVNVMSYNTQEEFPKREELRINPVLNWQHSSKLASFYRLIYNDSEEGTVEITQKSANGGIGYSGSNYNASMDIQAEDNQSTNLDYQGAGINYLISHNQLTSIGKIKLSYNGGLAYRDQVSDDTPFRIFGEEQEMNGTTPVTLNRDFIITDDSNFPIEVWNTGRTQIYSEGLDYEVQVVGSQTQIQRLVNSNIADGQIVLVDYTYKTGGTFALDLSNNNYQIIWDPSRFYGMYVRYRESNQKLREGSSSNPLNSINSLTYGIRADRPLLNGINFGGEAYFEDHEEDINSYTQLNYNAYIELPLPRLTSLRLSGRRQETINEELVDEDGNVDPNTAGNIDLTAYIMRIRSRPWLRTQLTFESSYETDTGGIQDRTQKIQRMQLSWSYRQLSLVTDAHFSSEEQDDVVRERWAIKFILRRVF